MGLVRDCNGRVLGIRAVAAATGVAEYQGCHSSAVEELQATTTRARVKEKPKKKSKGESKAASKSKNQKKEKERD